MNSVLPHAGCSLEASSSPGKAVMALYPCEQRLEWE